MFLKWRQFKVFRIVAFATLLLLFGLAVVSSASATQSPVINTNDNLIDGGWGAPIYTSTCSSGVPDQNEIESVWVQSWQSNGGNDGEIYFRMQTCTGPSFTSGLGGVAILDCDRNQTTNSVYDRIAIYNAAQDFVPLRDGTFFYMGTQCENETPGAAPCSIGERITTSNDTNEWRINYSLLPNSAGSAFPPGCRDAVNVGFAVANLTSGAISDQTPLFGWNVPTAVEVKQIKAYNQTWFNYLGLGALVFFIVIGSGAVIIYRRKQA